MAGFDSPHPGPGRCGGRGPHRHCGPGAPAAASTSLGNDGRCSIIGREMGFENLSVDAMEGDTSTHGNEASFEFIVEKDPEYIFVLDRDAAIQTEGAQLAQEVMENDLVKGTQAYQHGNIVYLAHPAVWYTAEGGITALDLMLQDLESELLEE